MSSTPPRARTSPATPTGHPATTNPPTSVRPGHPLHPAPANHLQAWFHPLGSGARRGRITRRGGCQTLPAPSSSDGRARGGVGRSRPLIEAAAGSLPTPGPRTVGAECGRPRTTLEVSDMAKKQNKQDHAQALGSSSAASREAGADPPAKMKRKRYEREMRRLHGELVAMQEWVKASGAKICVVFEGRTPPARGARSSGSPKRVSPRVFRSSPCPPRPSASGHRCTCSATSRISRPPGRS